MPIRRASRPAFVIALLVVAGLAGLRGMRALAEDAKPTQPTVPWAAADAAVAAGEADAKKLGAAKSAVEAAVAANPSAVGPHLLAARVWAAYGLPAKSSPTGQQAFVKALEECSKAAEIDVRDPEPWRLRVKVLDAMNAPAADENEALRAVAIRLPGDAAAREDYKKRAGKIPQLKSGDPMPLVVWKDSAGKDVPVAELWA